MLKIRRFSLAFGVCLASMLWLFGLLGGQSLSTANAEKSLQALTVTAPLTAPAPCGQEFVFNAGIADDFDPTIAPELTQPSSELQEYVTERYSIERREFDDISDISSNRIFAHTFTNLPLRFPGQPICAASLKIHLKAGFGETSDDSLRLAFVDDSGLLDEWERYLGSGNEFPGLTDYDWAADVSATISLNLAKLPLAGGDTWSILPALNQYGFLDVLVADNTGVDYVSLTVWYEREETSGDLIEVGDGGFASAVQLVGLGPSSVLSATISTISATLTIGECVSTSFLGANQQLCLYHIASAHSVTEVLASIPPSTTYTFEPNYIMHANPAQDIFGSPGEAPGMTMTTGSSVKSQWAINQVGGLPAGLPTGDGVEVAIFDTSCFSVPPNAYKAVDFMDTSMTVLHPFTSTYASLPYTSTTHANICGHGEYAASLIHTVAPSATLSLYRILDDTGRGDLFTLHKMLNTFISDTLAATGTLSQTVINLSLGVAAPLTPTTPTTTTLQTLLDAAHSQGAVIVGAAGNSSNYDVISPTQQPAAYDFVIGVAASDHLGDRAFYSNSGQVAAPGGFGHCRDVVTSTHCLVGVDQTSTTRYRTWAGTSFAAPLVSGLAALLLEQNPSYLPNEVADRIYDRASVPSRPDPHLGAGIINVPCTVGHPSCIHDVRTTNVRDVSFTVSWLTDVQSTGLIRYGTDPNNLNQTAEDVRGASTTDDTHYVLVDNLLPNTTYYFDVVSAGTTDDNDGAHYTVTTGAILGLPSSDTIYGQVAGEDGSTLAVGAIVYITLEEADGAGSSGQAAALSALVDNSGYWSINLGNARRADLSSYFLYSASGDQLQLEAQGAADGIGCERVDTAADSPATDIVLNVSQCTMAWPMSLQSGWNHISLPVLPITTPLMAADVCNDINAQGGNAVEIDRWHLGGWEGHICGLPFNNFELVLGSDYFIKSSTASSWIIEGYEVTEAVPLDLQVGWTSIGIPHSDGYNAESLCDEIISQGVSAVEIDRWHNGGWDGHICGLPFNDFNIERGTGYFVKSDSSGTVTPSEPASSPLQQPQRSLTLSPDDIPTGKTLPVNDLRISNLRDTSVMLSWTTEEATTGYVHFGETEEHLEQMAYDSRGAATSRTTHYILLDDLKPQSSYHFEIVSGAEIVESGTISTLSSLERIPQSDTVYGKVYMADGVTPATSALVYFTLQDGDGTGDTGEATLLSALVDSNGYWQANLGNARLADGRLFDYSVSGDELLIDVQGADGGTASQLVDSANDAPAADLYLANEPTSITVGAFDASASWQGTYFLLTLTMLAGTLLAWRRLNARA